MIFELIQNIKTLFKIDFISILHNHFYISLLYFNFTYLLAVLAYDGINY